MRGGSCCLFSSLILNPLYETVEESLDREKGDMFRRKTAHAVPLFRCFHAFIDSPGFTPGVLTDSSGRLSCSARFCALLRVYTRGVPASIKDIAPCAGTLWGNVDAFSKANQSVPGNDRHFPTASYAELFISSSPSPVLRRPSGRAGLWIQ